MTQEKQTKKIYGATYCRPEKKGKGVAPRTSGRYCPDCGLKKRGSNHVSGGHHMGLSWTKGGKK